MTLLELLVKELHKYGGWPDGAVECVRYVDEATIDFYDEDGNWDDDCSLTYGAIAVELVRKKVVSCENERVTLDEYESALAASQKVEWSGDGLPPVGCECEARYREVDGAEWFFFRCVGVDCGVAFGWAGKEAVAIGKGSYEFRPLRTEADKKRDAAAKEMARHANDDENRMFDAGLRNCLSIYDAIAAGKIPGVKLDD